MRLIKRTRWPWYVAAIVGLCFLVEVGTFAWDLATGNYWLVSIPIACTVWLGLLVRHAIRRHEMFEQVRTETDRQVAALLARAKARQQMNVPFEFEPIPPTYTPSQIKAAKKDLEKLYKEIA